MYVCFLYGSKHEYWNLIYFHNFLKIYKIYICLKLYKNLVTQTAVSVNLSFFTKADFSKAAMGDLQNLFGLCEKDAQYVLVSCHSPNITEWDILHNLHNLRECGIAGAQIHRIPWILAHKSGLSCLCDERTCNICLCDWRCLLHHICFLIVCEL